MLLERRSRGLTISRNGPEPPDHHEIYNLGGVVPGPNDAPAALAGDCPGQWTAIAFEEPDGAIGWDVASRCDTTADDGRHDLA